MPTPRTTRGMRPQRAPTRERAREGRDFFFGGGGVAVEALPGVAVEGPPGAAAEDQPEVAPEAPAEGAADGPPDGGVGGVGVDGGILEVIGKRDGRKYFLKTADRLRRARREGACYRRSTSVKADLLRACQRRKFSIVAV